MGGRFRVGSWLVQPELNTALRDHTSVHLTPKVIQVLVCLAKHAGQSVTKEELIQAVWPDTFVSDDVLKGSISELRRAFEDDAKEPHVIQTIPKRGYRLIAPVEWITDAVENLQLPPAQTAHRERISNPRKSWMAAYLVMAALAGLILVDIAGVRTRLTTKGTPQIHSLAVLPLRNLSADPSEDYFSDGITDDLITQLAQLSSLKLVSHTSTLRYKGTKKLVPQIARELNVDGIMAGTVQHSGENIRVNVQLIHGPSDKHVWANSYDRSVRDLFSLEREVTEEVTRQIGVRVTRNGKPQTPPLPMDPKAVEAFLQGRYHFEKHGKGFGDEEKRKAAQYFEQAIAADPSFAPSYNWLALSHENLWLGTKEDMAAKRKAAQKAVQIDPDYADAQVTVAALKWEPDLDWARAEQDLRRIVAANPNSGYPHSALCMLLEVLGHVEEGLRECKVALRIDQFDEDAPLGLYFGRDYDDSIAIFRALLQRDPDVGTWHCNLFPNYAKKAMYKEAVEELAKCYVLYGYPEAGANMDRAFANSGYRGALQQRARETVHLQEIQQAYLPGFLAQAYANLGDKDRAFYWLDQAYEHREEDSFDDGIYFITVEPMYDPLRSDPRFKEMVRKVGL